MSGAPWVCSIVNRRSAAPLSEINSQRNIEVHVFIGARNRNGRNSVFRMLNIYLTYIFACKPMSLKAKPSVVGFDIRI